VQQPEPLDESRPLPFRPGESPFKIKGVAYRGHLEYVSEFVDGGVDEMLRGFRDPALVEFFQQKFLPSTFYDIIPLIVAGYVCARQTRKSFSEFVRIRSRYQAERDVGGVYRVLIKLVSPMHVIERLSALQSQYLSFAEGGVEVLGDKHVLFTRPKLPHLLAHWTGNVLEAYVDVLLTRAGARNVLARPLPLLADGQVHGVAAVKWQCDVTWQ
jgi:hypothetical protein